MRKYTCIRNDQKESGIFYTWARKIASLKSILQFTGRNIRPCKEPKENASAHSKWAWQYEMGIISRRENSMPAAALHSIA